METKPKFSVYSLVLTLNWIFMSVYCQAPEESTHGGQILKAVVNSSVKLQCSVCDYRLALWLFNPSNNKPPITLSSGENIFNGEDYTLSILEDGNLTTYSLTILSVTEDMEGSYSCQEQGATKVDKMLLVEVLPSVWVEQDGLKVNSTINARIDETYDFSCVALGGRPTVSLSWNINDNNHSLSVTKKKVENGISSTLHYKPSIGDERLSCITSGQTVLPRVKVILEVNVLYTPICHIAISTLNLNFLTIHCTCAANPEVSRHYTFVNESFHSNYTNVVSSEHPASIACFAENSLGFSNKPTHIYKPSSNSTRIREEKDGLKANTTTSPITEEPSDLLNEPTNQFDGVSNLNIVKNSSTVTETIPALPLHQSQFPFVTLTIVLTPTFLAFLCSIFLVFLSCKKRCATFSLPTSRPIENQATITFAPSSQCQSYPIHHQVFFEDNVPLSGLMATTPSAMSLEGTFQDNELYYELSLTSSERKLYQLYDEGNGEEYTETSVALSSSFESICDEERINVVTDVQDKRDKYTHKLPEERFNAESEYEVEREDIYNYDKDNMNVDEDNMNAEDDNRVEEDDYTDTDVQENEYSEVDIKGKGVDYNDTIVVDYMCTEADNYEDTDMKAELRDSSSFSDSEYFCSFREEGAM